MLKQRNFLRAWHAKQYDGRPRKNPLFPDRESLPRMKVAIFVVASCVCVIGGFIGLIFAPFLTIQTIEIRGLTTLPAPEIETIINVQRGERRWLFAPQNNVFIFDQKDLVQHLMSVYQFEELSVEREGRVLVIHAKERILEIALKSGAKTYFLGVDGALIRETSLEEYKALDVRLGLTTPTEGEVLLQLQPTMPIIIDQSAQEPPAVSQDRIEALLALNERLLQQNITPVTYTFTNMNEHWTRVQTAQGYAILIDVTAKIASQLATLDVILNEAGSPVPYEYVDVRFGDHVYVK